MTPYLCRHLIDSNEPITCVLTRSNRPTQQIIVPKSYSVTFGCNTMVVLWIIPTYSAILSAMCNADIIQCYHEGLNSAICNANSAFCNANITVMCINLTVLLYC